MFRIRQVPDDSTPANASVIANVQAILKAQFSELRRSSIELLPARLRDPVAHGWRAILLVAEGAGDLLKGFAFVSHDPHLRFCYLDYLSAAPNTTGRGTGGALYQRVRTTARDLCCQALLFECLPDDPTLSPDPARRRQNAARLRFYEAFGARPIMGTNYETPFLPTDTDPPYLVLDDLDTGRPLSRETARRIVRAILVRDYGAVAPVGYIDRVVHSFRDDPVRLRPPRYQLRPQVSGSKVREPRVVLVVSEGHQIHHVREKGYLESPARVPSILKEIEPTGAFRRVAPRLHGESFLRAVHDPVFLRYLETISRTVPEGTTVYPYVFPLRHRARPPTDLPLRAGYYCIDTFTPLSRSFYPAARQAVDCALTAAEEILDGARLAYALVRPPGHHAGRESFGGFCYLNNAAVAASALGRYGRVAVLDVDYHHGNGTEDIFYDRSDVLTISIHGAPRVSYPYFSGFEDDQGEGEGKGFNVNYPLAEGSDGESYRRALGSSLRRIRRFDPTYLVVCLGVDTARGDPTGAFLLTGADFEANGRLIGDLGVPTLVVQEGGYRIGAIGTNVRRFFAGLVRARGV